MPQQINLLDASFKRKRETLGSMTLLIGLVATLGVAGSATLALRTMTARAAAQAGAIEQELAALQARVEATRVSGSSHLAAELARLRTLDAGQRRIRSALDAGQAGGAQGHSEYLFALSRQSQSGLWLTGFSIAPDGRSLELSGRMTSPRQLPGYLRRLNSEPLFKGREFAQLSLKTVETGTTTTDAAAQSAAGYADFSLRAAGAASEPHR
jgi:Tfp pilus assembly protein PilN